MQCAMEIDDKFSFPPMPPLTLLPALPERERTRNGSFSDDSDVAPVAPPVGSRVGLHSYSQQLEEYISRYRSRPPDIKFWPYGPYWPRYYEGVILETPRFLCKFAPFQESLAPKLLDEDGKADVWNRWFTFIHDKQRYSVRGCGPQTFYQM